ncbi:F-box protein [Rosa sericea]
MSVSSAESVANIEELLKQVLVWVPALSLIRFKCVSKHWLALISDPEFRHRHTLRNPNSKILAFFSKKTNEETFKSIPLGNHEIPPRCNPFKTLNNSVADEPKLRILQSCNGLFLCHIPIFREQKKHHPVYVVNPTTNQFRALSFPIVKEDRDIHTFVRYALAFDPSISPHYKVVCVNNFPHYYYDGGKHKIDIYSSETGEWKRLDTPFFPSPSDEGRHHDFMNKAMHFDYRSRQGAIYCNSAVHWITKKWGTSLAFDSFPDGNFRRTETDVLHYFDIGQERLLVASATPPLPLVVKNIPLKVSCFGSKNPTEWPLLTQRYFGECGGCLYLIEIYQHCNTQFEVMEMETDYSGWFVKYHVDLNPLVAALPGQDWNAFFVLCLSREEETSQEIDDKVEDSSTDLLVHMPGKVISYNLRNKTFKTSIELANKELYLTLGDNHCLREDIIFPYMETLACL